MTTNLSALFDNAKKVALVSVQPTEPSDDEQQVEEEDDDEEQQQQAKKTRTKKIKQREHEDRSVENAETVFVGNVPIKCTQKELKKLFSEFGTVKSVRLRNIIPLHAKKGKRLAFIKKEFHPLQKTINAFVRFADETQARSATSLNGHLYKEHHLRVDMAHDQHKDEKHDNKRSAFIGNLPFDASDDDVWTAFEECGEIESVRLVRDDATSVGKGFGYVLFKDEASVTLALRMAGTCRIGNREIRIKAAVKKPKPVKFPAHSKRPQLQVEQRPRKKKTPTSTDGIQQGRVGKRPSVKLKKEKQKKKKKHFAVKTNNARQGVIQLKKKS